MSKLPDDTVPLGLLTRPFGVEGEIRLQLDEEIESIDSVDVVFVEEGDGYLPWFLTSIRDHRDEAIRIGLEGIESPEKAREICGRKVRAKRSDVTLLQANASADWIGFELSDQDGKLLGKVKDIVEMPHQALAVIEYEGKSVLIPLVDDTLMEVNEVENRLQVFIAEGLLDL